MIIWNQKFKSYSTLLRYDPKIDVMNYLFTLKTHWFGVDRNNGFENEYLSKLLSL